MLRSGLEEDALWQSASCFDGGEQLFEQLNWGASKSQASV